MEDGGFMAEKEEAPPAKGGWLKGILGAAGGMLSGVVVMYLTPWVDKVAKPPVPVANFSVDYDGRTVHFHDKSQPGGDGWWDFGDGSPLVPVSADTTFLSHTYPRPGDYTVKLSLRNVLGDANERSVPIHIDASPASEKPQVTLLQAVPAHQGSTPGVVYAPATFRLVSRVEHATMCIWDLGDEPCCCEASTDTATSHGKHVTFKKPGRYVVKLIAINGTAHDERSTVVTVQEAPGNTVSVVANVTDTATCVETAERQVNLGVVYPADFTAGLYPFEQPFRASPGYTIANVVIPPPAGSTALTQMGGQTKMTLDCASLGIRSAQGVELQIVADRKSLTVTGQLIRQTGAGATALSLPLVLKQQRQRPASQTNPVSATLALPAPGKTATTIVELPAIPSEWVNCQRNVQMVLQAGEQVIWQGSQLPQAAVVLVGNRRFSLTATLLSNQLHVDLVDASAGLPPTAN
jgi:PKD repeat protein